MRRSWILCLVATVWACGGDSELSTNERALARDGLRSLEAEAVLIDSVERSFSGLIQFTPSEDSYQALHDAAAASVTSAKARLTPAGCLAATQSTLVPATPTDPVIEYDVIGCSAGNHALEGSVTSTWRLGDGLQIGHDLDLTIDGVATTGSATMTLFTAELETRQRSYALATSGLQLVGAWVAVFDTEGCGTRSGRGAITIEGGRTFERADDLGFCATETIDAITGTVDLARDGLEVRVRLLGDGEAEVVTRGRAFAASVGDLLD